MLRQQITDARTTLQVAAAARNFKEAGRIAAEAKALNPEKEELHAKLEKAGTDLEIIEKDITATTDKIQEREGLIVLKGQESAMTSYKRLRLDFSAARAELTAAAETDDSEEVEILQKEAEATESKALELKTLYNLQLDDDECMLQPVVPIAFITNSTWQHLAEIASSFGLSQKDQSYGFNTSKIQKLGLEFKGVEEMFDDSVESLKAHGYLPKSMA